MYHAIPSWEDEVDEDLNAATLMYFIRVMAVEPRVWVKLNVKRPRRLNQALAFCWARDILRVSGEPMVTL
jgi:hypothetical protein